MSIFLGEKLNDYEVPGIFLDKLDPTSFGAKIDCCQTSDKAFYVRYYAIGQSVLGESVTYHAHGYNQLTVHLGGDANTHSDGSYYKRDPGDVFVTRAGEPHGIYQINDENVEYLQLDFPLDAFDDSPCYNIFKGVFQNREPGKDNLLKPDEKCRDLIIKTCRRIIGILGSDPENKLLIYSYVIQLMYAIDSAFHSKSFFGVSDKMPTVVFEAVQYIYANLDSIESVDDISKQVNVSSSYLTRLFKSNLGFTPYEYLVDRKIENAKILMCYKGENVSEACRKAGFKDYSNFIALFKKKTGMTPLAYKKANS